MSTSFQSPLRIGWAPHSTNLAYAGVRLRYTIPAAVLTARGHRVHVIADRVPSSASAAVVQGKWLLDAGVDGIVSRRQLLSSLKDRGVPLILDSFDNYFLNEKGDPAREALLAQYRACLDLFDAFTVSSSGLKDFLSAEVGSKRPIFVVGDPIEGPGAHRLYESALQRWNPKRWPRWLATRLDHAATSSRRRTVKQLMWFGNSGSSYATAGGLAELARVLPFIEKAAAKVPLHLNVVSNSHDRYMRTMKEARFSHSYREWDRLYFADFLRLQDLVLLPASITAFTASKSNNRLLLPLSLGVPVLADEVPDYLPWKGHFSLAEWDRLAEFLEDGSALRQRAALAIEKMTALYSASALGDAWSKVLGEVVKT